MRYRKKPVVIEAHQWFKNGDHPEDGPAFEHGDAREGKVVRYYRRPDDPGTRECGDCPAIMHDHGWIDTLEGGHRVCPGDFVITGIKSERYPCKPDIFEAAYEPEEATDAVQGEGTDRPQAEGERGVGGEEAPHVEGEG